MATLLGRGIASPTVHADVCPADGTLPATSAPEPCPDDIELVAALRQGDEHAFAALLRRYYTPMLNLAMHYVSSRASAEDVVQEAWLGVLKGLDRFESRSSLKTWIFRILVNRAKTWSRREGRTLPFTSMGDPAADPAEPSVDPDRFLDANHPKWPHHWRTPPSDWGGSPEERLLSAETQGTIRRTIEGLPSSQRTVITLRDVEGWKPEEVCKILNLTSTNQRVLLHRARSKVRQSLEQYLEPR